MITYMVVVYNIINGHLSRTSLCPTLNKIDLSGPKKLATQTPRKPVANPLMPLHIEA